MNIIHRQSVVLRASMRDVIVESMCWIVRHPHTLDRCVLLQASRLVDGIGSSGIVTYYVPYNTTNSSVIAAPSATSSPAETARMIVRELQRLRASGFEDAWVVDVNLFDSTMRAQRYIWTGTLLASTIVES